MTGSWKLDVGFLTLLSIGVSGCAPKCVDTVIQRMPRPSGTEVAVLYTRECGATLGPTSNVAVVDSSAQLPDTGGNVLVMKDPVSMAETSRTTQLSWRSTDTLEVSILNGRTLKARAARVNGIVIILTEHGQVEP